MYRMETITLIVKNEKTRRLIDDLEALDLVEVVRQTPVKEKERKLSEILSGSLSKEQADRMRTELTEMRGEWSRDI